MYVCIYIHTHKNMHTCLRDAHYQPHKASHKPQHIKKLTLVLTHVLQTQAATSVPRAIKLSKRRSNWLLQLCSTII